MAIIIKKETECTGCSACYNICPQKCITMRERNDGFCYPEVDSNKCTQCGLCEKVCPIHSKRSIGNYEKTVYAAFSKDESIRYSSTSGGIFSELAIDFIKKGGVVVGAEYISPDKVAHVCIESIDAICKLRQSKYVQSAIGDIYVSIKNMLLEGKNVLFVGAPCQVSGLSEFLKGLHVSADKLFLIDFICRGVNSPKAFRCWISQIEKRYSENVKNVWFKYKEDGWAKSPRCTRVEFNSGNAIVYKGNENTFMSGYLDGNLYVRPSCTDCRFKGEVRDSDITLGDFWGVEGKLNDDQGTSLVIINSAKGKTLFKGIQSRIKFELRDYSEISKGNLCNEKSIKLNPKSKQFLIGLDSSNFDSLIKKYLKSPWYTRIITVAKRIIKKEVKTR